MTLPAELEAVREKARRAILPVKPADANTAADEKFLLTATRTKGGEQLPPYYLIYFLLVDLLGFSNLGRFEKLAWSVPIDFEGVAYLIDHRKFGVGVFAHKGEEWEKQATRIVGRIHKGVAAAKPLFKWMAESAVQTSELNVWNVGIKLFKRYIFFRDEFRRTADKALAFQQIQKLEAKQREFQLHMYSTRLPNRLVGWSYPHFLHSQGSKYQKMLAGWLLLQSKHFLDGRNTSSFILRSFKAM